MLLAGGASHRSIAKKFGLSHWSVGRHWANHVSEERRVALIMGPVQRQALASRVAEESTSVLDHHRAVRSGLYTRFDAAIEAGDNTAVALLAGRLTEINNSIAKLTGQIIASPLIANTVINNFRESNDFVRLRTELLQLGKAHPQIRADLVAMLRRLATEPVSSPAPASPRVIEHEGAHA